MHFRTAVLLSAALALCTVQRAATQSCTTQAQMDPAPRDALVQESIAAGKALVSGDGPQITAASAADFAAGAPSSAAPLSSIAHGATMTVDALWMLDATEAAANQPNAQFFCGIANAPAHATFTFSSLPADRYAVVFLHATGISAPQQIGLVLKDVAGAWKIAGFSFRPLTMAGHNALWYWTQARIFAGKRQALTAYLYYATAAYLALPVSYAATGNLEKLLQEQQSSAPTDLPRADHPLQLAGTGGAPFQVTDLSTDASLGGLDLVIRYATNDVSDPAATRDRNIAVMRAMLAAHPETRSAFHGIWVYAVAPGQAPFGIELPMNEIH